MCETCKIIVTRTKIGENISTVNTRSISPTITSNMLYTISNTLEICSTSTTMFCNELHPVTKSVRNLSMLHNLVQTVEKLEARIARINNMVSKSSVVSNFQSTNSTKTKKCQPDAGDRPDLIQTEPVPSIGLARQQNKNKQNEKLKIEKVSTFRLVLIGHGYPVIPSILRESLVWSLSSGHGHDRHTPRVTAKSRSSHGRHTPRVTAKSRSSHGQQTPRVTARTQSQPSGHTPHTPRVTEVVPVSQQRLTQNHNKNQLNEKLKNEKNKLQVA